MRVDGALKIVDALAQNGAMLGSMGGVGQERAGDKRVEGQPEGTDRNS